MVELQESLILNLSKNFNMNTEVRSFPQCTPQFAKLLPLAMQGKKKMKTITQDPSENYRVQTENIVN